MTTVTPSTALATIQPAFTDPERLALAGYLAGYRGLTRDAYTLDLRQFATWCRARSLNLFAVRRADIESFARDLETNGRARATVTRRLCTIAGFYRYAVEEKLLDHSPAARGRAPGGTAATPLAWVLPVARAGGLMRLRGGPARRRPGQWPVKRPSRRSVKLRSPSAATSAGPTRRSGVPAAMDAPAPAVVTAARSHGGQRTINMTAKLT